MPAPLKGLLIAASVIVAAGMAVYESPQVQEWMNRARRKITTALHELGDLGERPVAGQRMRADSNSTRRDPSEEEIAAAVDAARRKRDEALAQNPALFNRRARGGDQHSRSQQPPPPYQPQQQQQPQPPHYASSSAAPPRPRPPPASASTDERPSATGFATFDDFLIGDGAGAYTLRNTSTEPDSSEQTLRRRNNVSAGDDGNNNTAATAAAAASASGPSSAEEPAAKQAASVTFDDTGVIAPELREWQASRHPESSVQDTQPAEEPLIQFDSQPPSRASSAVPVMTPSSSVVSDHHWAYFSPVSSVPAAEQEHGHQPASASHPQAAEAPPATSGSTYFSINEWAESATPSFQRHAQHDPRSIQTDMNMDANSDAGAHAQSSGSNRAGDGVQSGASSPPTGRQLRPTPISVPTSVIAPQDSHSHGDGVDTRSPTIYHSDGHETDTDDFADSDDDYGAQRRLADEVLSFTSGTAASTTPGTWTEVGSEVSENDIGP